MIRYTACGLQIDSEIPAHHLLPGDPDRPCDLSIRAGSAIPPFEIKVSTPQWRQGHDRLLLFGYGGEACLCIAGREMIFVRDMPFLDETCTLLGRALSVICLQRGLPVFHAAVLERDGKTVALGGRSGAGKSTLAMELVSLGFRIVADDIAACDVGVEGVMARPLYPVTRRRSNGLALPGWKAIPGTEKQVSTDVPFCSDSRRIDRMMVIEVATGGPLQIADVPTAQAAAVLEAQNYRKGLARTLLGYGGLKEIMERAARVMPVTGITRPPDYPAAQLAASIVVRLERA